MSRRRRDTARGEQAIHGRSLDYRTPRTHAIDTYDMSDFLGPRYERSNLRPFDQE